MLAITTGPDGNIWFTEYSAHAGGACPSSETDCPADRFRSRSRPAPTATSGSPSTFRQDRADHAGRRLTELPAAGANDLSGIAAGPDGNLWFTEFATNQIGRITPAGTITEFPVPTATAVPTGSRRARTATSGSPSRSATRSGGSPRRGDHRVPDPDRRHRSDRDRGGPRRQLWFTEAASTDRPDHDGRRRHRVPDPPSASPAAITAGPDGNLWFTEVIGQPSRADHAGRDDHGIPASDRGWVADRHRRRSRREPLVYRTRRSHRPRHRRPARSRSTGCR